MGCDGCNEGEHMLSEEDRETDSKLQESGVGSIGLFDSKR